MSRDTSTISHHVRALIIAFAFISIQGTFTSQPSHATTTSGSATVEILQLIQISEVQGMDFGTILTNNGLADTISLSTAGNLTAGSSSSHSGSISRSGQFSANGTPNSTLSISFQDALLSGGGSTITVSNFTHNAGATPTLDASGTLIFNVGADLTLSENQAVGVYSGSYQITINYQ